MGITSSFGELKFQSTLQVRIVLEGVEKFSNLIVSIYYPDGESAKDLALELVENVSHNIHGDLKIGGPRSILIFIVTICKN